MAPSHALYSVFRFLMTKGEELPFIHCQVYDGRPVTSAKVNQAVLCLISFLSCLKKQIFDKFCHFGYLSQ